MFHQELLVGAFFVALVATCAVAMGMLLVHQFNVRRAVEREEAIQALSLCFAEHLTGRSDASALRAAAAAAPAHVLWRTLERFADVVEGEEWERVSAVLRDLPVMAREVERMHDRRAWRRALAARHVGLLGGAVHHDVLLATMMDGPTIVTLAAALSLARTRDRRALGWILEHPEATEGQGRHRLVAVIKRFGRGHVAEVREALRGRRAEGTIYLAAIECLGLWKDRRSRPLLEATLMVGGKEARTASARALGRLASRSSVPVLRDALRDPAWQVRGQAAWALGRIRLNALAPDLERALSDPAWWVRRNAAYALGRQGRAGRETLHRVAQLGRDRYAREMAIEVLQLLAWERTSPGGLSRVE